ncbi:hypothetical protein [Nocardia yamanashiensis]|uniref:hypothetical protein n=1 Tax=Nocardia yamanashiensis TaxID=209247 RepID=UPI00082C344F|nr:hypothetical protein [Nocardia yamanashiensis]
MNPSVPLRALGVATAAYGAAVAVRPEILLRPAGLGIGAEPELRALARMVALRDLASGLALAVARNRRARTAAVAVRIASDAADTAVFAHALAGRAERPKALAVTTIWGLLSAAAAVYEYQGGSYGGGRAAAGVRRP